MAECNLLTGGIPKDCKPNIGGLFTTMYMTERSNVTAYVKGSPASNITGITMASPAKFYPFVFNKGTSGFVESQTFDNPTGNSLNTQTITLVLNHREQSKKDKIVMLGSFKELAIIVKTNNGNYFVMGEVGGCVLSTNEGGSGVAKSDANNYTLTFIGEEAELANEVTEAAVLAVI